MHYVISQNAFLGREVGQPLEIATSLDLTGCCLGRLPLVSSTAIEGLIHEEFEDIELANAVRCKLARHLIIASADICEALL
jgi:hypothetical protein